MTWIVGGPIPFGYAVALSDIRVTLADGRERDCLQKIYPVGPFLALGFAGSVAIGFAMVDRLRDLLGPPQPGMAWEPDVVAGWWPQDSRELFAKCPETEKSLGCHLLLAGAHPARNNGDAPWAKSYVYRFRSPEFTAEDSGSSIVSIGSGEGVAEYAAALERLSGDGFSYLRHETMNPGGAALGLLHAISHAVDSNPRPGISRHLHVCAAMRDRILIANNDRKYLGEPKIDDFLMPPVARTYQELLELLGASGQAPSQATC